VAVAEKAWQERDLIQFVAMVEVERYWLQTDEENARRTLLVRFSQELELADIQLQCNEVRVDEQVFREKIWSEYAEERKEVEYAALANFLSSSYHALARENIEAERTKADITNMNLPPIAQRHVIPVAPMTPPPRGSARKLEQKQRAVTESAPWGHLAAMVFDAEGAVRTRIIASFTTFIELLLESHHHYLDASEVLRQNFRKPLTLEEAEIAQRCVIEGDYFGMLLSACECVETLSRRQVDLVDSRMSFDTIKSSEQHQWLDARRTECHRKIAEEEVERHRLRQARVHHVQMEMRLQMERQMFERVEADGRFDIVRQQQRGFANVVDLFNAEYSGALLAQRRFELRNQTVIWTKESYDSVYLGEAVRRNKIFSEERDAFVALRSREVSSFLSSRRNVLINDDMDRQLLRVK
jgi:hypothetical protein